VRCGKPGRPVISSEVRDLIRKMCRENPGWGAPRIHGELLKLGIDIGQSSVSKYMVRCRKPPSQTWRTFLENHAQQLVSIDFFTVPTMWSRGVARWFRRAYLLPTLLSVGASLAWIPMLGN
jgi:putative transposase